MQKLNTLSIFHHPLRLKLGITRFVPREPYMLINQSHGMGMQMTMSARWLIITLITAFALGARSGVSAEATPMETIQLPPPKLDGGLSVEQSLHKRRSVRRYRGGSLPLDEVSQLLWAAQGITSVEGFRTAPSAGALYPLEVYLVAGDVTGLTEGIYRHLPQGHRLVQVGKGDKRGSLAAAALGQQWVGEGAAALVFSAVYERTTRKYGSRGSRYVHIEVGHAAQNVFLQAVSDGLNAVVVGAFDDEAVKRVIQMPEQEQPLYIMPIGK